MAFIIGLPVAQIILFCVSIGHDPVGLRMAIVNNELNDSMEPCIATPGCDYTRLSCRFLDHLTKRTVVLLPYDDEDKSVNAVERGWAWGAISFPSNYSQSLKARMNDGIHVTEWDSLSAEMNVVMDMSSKHLE